MNKYLYRIVASYIDDVCTYRRELRDITRTLWLYIEAMQDISKAVIGHGFRDWTIMYAANKKKVPIANNGKFTKYTFNYITGKCEKAFDIC